MIELRELSLSFGEQKIFNTISQTFKEHQKIGVVGRNGAGKSTLLRVIARHQPLDSGTISIHGDKTIAYMPQEMTFDSDKTVFDEAFTVFSTFTNKQEETLLLEKKLSTNPKNALELTERYSYLLSELSHFNEREALNTANSILDGLGFTNAQKSMPVQSLSIGWKMRLLLAKLLLQNADFYLFDEPTNHLDLPSKEWFIQFLKQQKAGYLLVSHDRYFLDQACDHIYEISLGNAKLYMGNYSSFIHRKNEEYELLQKAHANQQKEIERKEKTIERFRSKATKAKMVKSMIKQLDKIDRIELESSIANISISFPPATRSGTIVLTIRNLSYAFGEKQLFQDVSAQIMRGQKIALVAPNGTGKSTLFNLIVQRLTIQSGSIEFGHNVQWAYFEQDQTAAMNPKRTILQEVQQSLANIDEKTIRTFLGAFLFTGEDVFKYIGDLSGGEKNRVAIVKVLLKQANFLLLDEPTNHLDMQSKDLLLQALKQYNDTILLVSHDHDFVARLADTIYELNHHGLFSFPGTYEAYLKQQAHHSIEAKNPVQKERIATDLPKEINKQIKQIERAIDKLEQKRKQLLNKFEFYEYGTCEYKNAEALFTKTEKEISTLMVEWEDLQKRSS